MFSLAQAEQYVMVGKKHVCVMQSSVARLNQKLMLPPGLCPSPSRLSIKQQIEDKIDGGIVLWRRNKGKRQNIFIKERGHLLQISYRLKTPCNQMHQ